jgi:hypothetical protein
MIDARRGAASGRAWQLLLDGPSSESARAAVVAIAASLADSLPAEDDPSAASPARYVALNSGLPDLALFYAYLGRSTGESPASIGSPRMLGASASRSA